MSSRRANRLAREKSPYLLQHAHNPVDWHPWGDEAFALARGTNRPIFLSIGYATCHWCHVMERESFEDERVAALLNEHFVPIKVDREERPDVDRVYMTAMQAKGWGGGWPLNVFLTPDLAPFFGGTYFPPERDRHGRPGMLELLPRVVEAWREEKDALEEDGRRLLGALADFQRTEPSGDAPAIDALCDTAFAALERGADPEWGGFGRAPKFPTPANLAFLWADAARIEPRDPDRARRAREIALLQLDRMAARGIHDHLGGGFHRYSVDRTWLVPHFEKMLYDQAQLACAYLDAHRATGDAHWADVARGVFEYVARDLTGPHGAFLSAEDADSEGEEGRFYVWRPADLVAELDETDAALFAARYGVTASGNFEHDTTILHEAAPLADAAREAGISDEEARTRLAGARARLFATRARRPRPLCDDKVIAAWNGLMITAFARGAAALDDPELARRGARAAEFVLERMWDEPAGALARRWRDGEAASSGQLDDYAFLARALLDLFQATFEPAWLERGLRLAEAMIACFAAGDGEGFYESPAGDASIRVRMKDDFDGAELAGNSIALSVLAELAAWTGREDLERAAGAIAGDYARRLATHPQAMPRMLVAMLEAAAPRRHVVIASGDRGPAGDDARALLAAARAAKSPHDLVVLTDGREGHARVAALVPFAMSLVARDGAATAYVCVDRACHAPTHDPAALAADLNAR